MDQNLELKLTHILTYGDFFFSFLSDSIKTQMDMWIFLIHSILRIWLFPLVIPGLKRLNS